jgi:hypothetical protein
LFLLLADNSPFPERGGGAGERTPFYGSGRQGLSLDIALVSPRMHVALETIGHNPAGHARLRREQRSSSQTLFSATFDINNPPVPAAGGWRQTHPRHLEVLRSAVKSTIPFNAINHCRAYDCVRDKNSSNAFQRVLSCTSAHN